MSTAAAPGTKPTQAPHQSFDSRAGGSFDRTGGRRYTLTGVSALAYVGLLVGGYIDQGGFVTLQLMTVGAYLAANGHQKHLEIKNGTATQQR